MSSQPDTEDVAARAEVLLELGRRQEAISLLGGALAVKPAHAHLVDLLAQAQLELAPATARRTAERLIELAPENHRGHLLASLACSDTGDKRGAVRFARQAAELAPWSANVQARLAESLGKRHFAYRRAMRAATTAIELAPEATVGYIAAGNVDLSHGHKRRAARWYRRALEVDPMSHAAQWNTAVVGKARGRLVPSLREVESMLRRNPSDERARRLLDELAYASLAHLQWFVLLAIILLSLLRG